MKKIELDGETADRITVSCLKEHRDFLKKELKEWKKNPKTDSNPQGYWLHPEDVAEYTLLIEAINLLLNQYFEAK